MTCQVSPRVSGTAARLNVPDTRIEMGIAASPRNGFNRKDMGGGGMKGDFGSSGLTTRAAETH